MATIADVAKRAGVSPTTVSHVLSGNRPVAPETRRRVGQAIEDLGFRPNALASSLRKQRSQTVALIIPDITNPYYPVLARGLQDALAPKSYHTFLCNTDADRDHELAFVADLAQRRVDGMVLVSFQLSADDLTGALNTRIPVIAIGSVLDHPFVDVVMTDDQQGATDATAYLIQRGHRRIGMIGGVAGLPPSEARFMGYYRALVAAELPYEPSLMVRGDFTRASGAAAMRELLTQPQPPTAVFCANDLMAIGALDVARDMGLRMPDDVAIVGYDDIDAASLVTPALTTVINPAYQIGLAAGALLLDRLEGHYEGPRRRRVIAHRVIVRDSA